MPHNEKPKKKASKVRIILLIIVSIGMLLLIIAFGPQILLKSPPWRFTMERCYCNEAESAARSVAAAIADYFAPPQGSEAVQINLEDSSIYPDSDYKLTEIPTVNTADDDTYVIYLRGGCGPCPRF